MRFDGKYRFGSSSIVALCGATSAIFVVDLGMPTPLAFLAAIFIGTLSGVVVGFFVSVFSIPPFIVTLATMLMGRGLTYTMLQAQTKGPLPKDYTFLGIGFLPNIHINIGSFNLDLVPI